MYNILVCDDERDIVSALAVVYLNLNTDGGKVSVILKNISETPLNLTSDELFERFTRGDCSRSTEGNGLGLSIAESLIKLQNGDISINIDGDLFKVTVTFDICKEVDPE